MDFEVVVRDFPLFIMWSKLLSQHQPWSWARYTQAEIRGGENPQNCKAADGATIEGREIQTEGQDES